MADNIKAPSHYVDGRKYEPKDVIRDWGLNFNLGSTVKYISRAGRKGDKLEDLQKAKQFLQFEIEADEKANEPERPEKLLESDVNRVLNSAMYVTDFTEPYQKEIINRIVERIDKGDLDYIDIPLHLSRNYQEIKNAIERKTSWYTNGVLGHWYYYQNIPDGYKARVINNIAQEVLDSQIIPPDEICEAVIDRIVERINNDELDCFDISYNLYNAYQDIRDAIARQAFRKVGEKQKSDIGMTCKEAAEIGDAIAKGIKKGLKEAAENHNGSEENSDIEIETVNEHMISAYVYGLFYRVIVFNSIPDEYKPIVIDKIAQKVLNNQWNIVQDIPTKELRDMVIDWIIELINNDKLDRFDIPSGLYNGCRKIRDAIVYREYRKAADAVRKYAEDTVSINFEFEVDPEIDTDTVNIHVHIKNKED